VKLERYSRSVTESEARQACSRLAAEHPDRRTHRWRPRREIDGSWSVIKIALAPEGPLGTEIRAEEKPPTPDDPRSAAMQNLGPHIGPGL
jgi:hypothetical protein